MGYPMTWRRLISRNGLVDGDYGIPPERLKANVNLKEKGLYEAWEVFDCHMAPHYRERIEDYQSWAADFAGDLRRLEKDARDEGAICQHIAARTGIYVDVVAAVLKEFLDW